ncbi:MAG: GntR family transcriptional regulator, partial [Vicinamibacterales bacterium]
MMDFPVQLDRRASVSLQEQLTEQLRRAILDGRLASGMRLPSTRTLAAETRISRNVVLAAYDELYAEG